MSTESEGMEFLLRKFEESLRQHAKDLGASDGLPELDDIFGFQLMLDAYNYFTTVHSFLPEEVCVLLDYNDPLEVATACWDLGGTHSPINICGIVKEEGLTWAFDHAKREPERVKAKSLMGQLREAQMESRRQAQKGVAECPGKTERSSKSVAAL